MTIYLCTGFTNSMKTLPEFDIYTVIILMTESNYSRISMVQYVYINILCISTFGFTL